MSQVSLEVPPGDIHALIGPNGAGKTTLLRILAGLMDPSSGRVKVLEDSPGSMDVRRRIGWVPSGDRTFYLRISGFENLLFFGRLHGMSRRASAQLAREVLERVGLADVGRKRVGLYSHGMQKRLSIARALLIEPDILLLDEATHDLDPLGSGQTQALVKEAAQRGAAVVWATQRLEEVGNFAHTVTLLADGEVRFSGTVPELIARAPTRRYLLRLRGPGEGMVAEGTLNQILTGRGTISRDGDSRPDQYVLYLNREVVLGDAIASLALSRVQVLACREQRSEVEEAFLRLIGEDQ